MGTVNDNMQTYDVTVDVRTDVNASIGLQSLTDIVAEGLERIGFTEVDYRVEVHGPPELRIGIVPR